MPSFLNKDAPKEVIDAALEKANIDQPRAPEVHKHSAFGSLISRQLPAYSGPYDVGVCDVEAPVEPRMVGTFLNKSAEPGSKPGFRLDTVLYTLFYPSEKPHIGSKNIVWFPRLRQTIDGFLEMADRTSWLYRSLAYPIAAAAIWGTTFPATKEPPLLTPPSSDKKKQWPVAIFSHGVGCSRLMYSAFAGNLASQGYVVAAIEHRDGTGPCSTISVERGGKTENVDFLRWTDVKWPDLSEQPLDDTILRHDQIKMRLLEIEECIKSVRGILGLEAAVHQKDLLLGDDYDFSSWAGKVDAERIILTGHSLGGSAVLAAAAEPTRFDPSHCIAMDPAIQRLEPWVGSIDCPTLCVNSDEFQDSEDFDRLLSLSKTVKDSASIFSIGGSTHPSFSDVFLIIPGCITKQTGMPCKAPIVFDHTLRCVLGFLEGGIEAIKSSVRSVQGRQKRPVGAAGELVLHV